MYEQNKTVQDWFERKNVLAFTYVCIKFGFNFESCLGVLSSSLCLNHIFVFAIMTCQDCILEYIPLV